MEKRQLKVRESLHSYQLDQAPNQRTPIREIQLKGHWLIQAGFKIDDAVTVKVDKRCLVVTCEESG